jgi:hypothetical protein
MPIDTDQTPPLTGDTHIWYVSVERAERIWELLEQYRNREIPRELLQERLLGWGMPQTMQAGDHLNIQITKRIQSTSTFRRPAWPSDNL